MAPVFVVGCHRSGTNLLYDMLLSAGGFAIYRGYLPVYEKLIPRFGSLNKWSHRKRMTDVWLRSQGFRRSGLDSAQIRGKILEECRTGGDFIRIVMNDIARAQSVSRWAVYNPDNVLRINRIKAEIPNALFIHIIRDGRDIALSLKKMGFYPFPWRQASKSLSTTGLYWDWVVQKGRQYGRSLRTDYLEIHYEDLVCEPEHTLSALGKFLAHDLDYDAIRKQGLGRLRDSNSSFVQEGETATLNPVNRWRNRLTLEQVAELECAVGDTLQQFGYPLTTEGCAASYHHRCLRTAYRAFFETKLWLKASTPLGRFSNLSMLELSDAVAR